jgi:GH15 family glucan-1,4-alpha-glucosidase
VTTPIADYAIVGDGRSAALISRAGSLDWLCWPRFDSPSIFAALLDEERGGRFSVAPAAPFRSTRSYLGETNVLQTRFRTASGELALTDFMPVLSRFDSARSLHPGHELVRVARCEGGEVEVEIVFDPRPDYGRRKAVIRSMGKLGLRVDCGGDAILSLLTDGPLGAEGRARLRLRGGEEIHFSLSYACGAPAVLPPPTRDRSAAVLERALQLWREWASRTKYDGPARDLVVRSALVLKLLQYAPSGAIVAAPTTSLPERPGGDLNWDYRFCWLRDAALTARALFGLGHGEEAENFMSWLLTATSLSLPELHVLYDMYGRRPGAETELEHLSGYGRAKPVRIGNAATGQVQLDTYGEVIEAATYFVRSGGQIDRPTANMLCAFGREVATSFDRPDEGIWEVRDVPRRFTHSRVLCWSALDRLCELAEKGHVPKADVDAFAAARDRIREEVETLGWSEQLHSYTRTLAGADVDAGLLLLPWYRYCPADAPRMRSTWRRIRERLEIAPGLFRRYYGGLTAGEGAFGICSFWAAEYLALGGGTPAEAEEQLDTVLGYANDVGLFAEEIDPASGAALGNFPQAYTHVGVINAALSLRDRLERGKREAERARTQMPEARP